MKASSFAKLPGTCGGSYRSSQPLIYAVEQRYAWMATGRETDTFFCSYSQCIPITEPINETNVCKSLGL